jgi:hypothetical protein
MMSPDERYYNDPIFQRLVDSIYMQIREGSFTPTELREAAMLASIRYSERNLSPKMVIPDKVSTAMETLEHWRKSK